MIVVRIRWVVLCCSVILFLLIAVGAWIYIVIYPVAVADSCFEGYQSIRRTTIVRKSEPAEEDGYVRETRLYQTAFHNFEFCGLRRAAAAEEWRFDPASFVSEVRVTRVFAAALAVVAAFVAFWAWLLKGWSRGTG